MDAQQQRSALPISDNPRVSVVGKKTTIPSENSRIPRLVVAWLTMVVSLMVDIFPSNISTSTLVVPLPALTGVPIALTGAKRGLLMISMPVWSYHSARALLRLTSHES
jgi:hypothetical protein